MDNKSVYSNFFAGNNFNFISQLFHSDESMKNILKAECAVQNKDHFCWLEPINAVPEIWKICVKQTSENTSFLVVKDRYLLRGSGIIKIEKLSSEELFKRILIKII